MITEPRPGLDRSMSRQYGIVADDAGVTRTAASLEANGISVLRAADAEEAKRCGCRKLCHLMRPGHIRGSGRRADPAEGPGRLCREQVDARAWRAGSAATGVRRCAGAGSFGDVVPGRPVIWELRSRALTSRRSVVQAHLIAE